MKCITNKLNYWPKEKLAQLKGFFKGLFILLYRLTRNRQKIVQPKKSSTLVRYFIRDATKKNFFCGFSTDVRNYGLCLHLQLSMYLYSYTLYLFNLFNTLFEELCQNHIDIHLFHINLELAEQHIFLLTPLFTYNVKFSPFEVNSLWNHTNRSISVPGCRPPPYPHTNHSVVVHKLQYNMLRRCQYNSNPILADPLHTHKLTIVENMCCGPQITTKYAQSMSIQFQSYPSRPPPYLQTIHYRKICVVVHKLY